MKLAIVESPSKAKTIKKYLGDDYEVEASVGHVRDLPKSAKGAIDIEAGFVPNYEIPESKQKVVDKLRKMQKKADEIILATDPDREGEAIAWHVGEVLGLDYDSDKVKRITFNEITKEAVQEALKNARKIDTDLRHAQEARRVLDRIFGYDLSELIWIKVRYGL
jgi:DNA topoisomerase-1